MVMRKRGDYDSALMTGDDGDDDVGGGDGVGDGDDDDADDE